MIQSPYKNHRAAIAAETMSILQNGFYINTHNERVDTSNSIDEAIRGTQCYTPEELDVLLQTRTQVRTTAVKQTSLELTNETSFACTQRLIQDEKLEHVCCLNFASAKNPGGGFLGGAQAQEESLARASALYPCLLPQTSYYNSNRKVKSCLYTDYIIYSPAVPVLRNSMDTLLDNYYRVSIITAPAVNAGVVHANEPKNIPHIESTMLRRMAKVLAVAEKHEHNTLVLGAWGCGVFRNNARDVAQWFALLLTKGGAFDGIFERVIFAVYDSSKEKKVYTAFEQVLSV